MTHYAYELIGRAGNYGPFVYRDKAGIHVGDNGSHNVFQTVEEALAHCRGVRLSGGHLSKCRAAAAGDCRNNEAAEYYWHQDAGLQIAALMRLATRARLGVDAALSTDD